MAKTHSECNFAQNYGGSAANQILTSTQQKSRGQSADIIAAAVLSKACRMPGASFIFRTKARPRMSRRSQTYLAEAGGDDYLALTRAIADALADLTEMERRSLRAQRLVSRGFVRGRTPVAR